MFIALRQTWGDDRVFFYDENRKVCSLPAAWTDAVEQDVFVALAAGRCAFRIDDLVALTAMVAASRGGATDGV